MRRFFWCSLFALLVPLTASASDIQFSTPKGWKKETPTSKMRVAQYCIPKQKGDPKDAELVVYFFGPSGGGTVEQNLERWKTQMVPAKGDPSPKQTEKTVGGFKVTILDQVGTHRPPSFRGPKNPEEPESRMLAAIIQSIPGPYFVKFVGPKLTVTKAEPEFYEFIEGIKFKSR